MLLCQFLVPAGNKKKDTVVCLAGCAVVSVFGSGDYDWKNKVTVVCLAGCAVVSVFGSGDYDRKKNPVVIKFVLVQLESKLIQIR